MKRVIIALAIVVIAQTTDAQRRERAVRPGKDFFSTTTLDLAQLQPEQVRRYRAYEALPSTLSLRVTDIIAEPNHSPVLTLNLLEGRSYIATMTRLDETDGGYTWEGVLGGDGGSAILVVRGSQITGWVWATRIGLDDEFYDISAIGGHTHVIRQTNQDWFDSVLPGCQTGEQPLKSIPATLPDPDHDREGETEAEPGDRFVPSNLPGNLSMQKSATSNDSFCVTTVMVAYTPAAQNAQGNIPALAQLAVNVTNASYARSGIDALRLSLVGTMLVNYTESGMKTTDGTPKDLIRLKETSDSWMDDVHPMRSSLGADVVVLFVDNLESLDLHGAAYQVMATHDTAFAVVSWQAAVGNLTFAHEVGHLQGAGHHDDSGSPYEYGHGACREWPYNYRTIMATETCKEKRAPYWSNPDVSYKLRKTGDSSFRNNARVLNETSCTIGKPRSILKTVAMLSYQGSVITAFDSGGIYSSPNGLNLGGGGSTKSVYPGPQKVIAMISYQPSAPASLPADPPVTPRVITAFEGGGIYSSPDGLNLGGGGSTEAVYSGPQKVRAMISYQGSDPQVPPLVITAFEGGGIYSSPNGKNLGGGGGTTSVYPGPQRVIAMISYKGRVITAFEDGGIYSSPNGKDLGGGGSTEAVYPGPQRVTAMISYNGRVITAFEGGGIYSSPNGKDLGGGGSTEPVYPGTQKVRTLISYQEPGLSAPLRVITAFEDGGIYSSPNGKNLGGGPGTDSVYPGPQGVRAMIAHQGWVITAFEGGGIFSSPNGRSLGGGNGTINVYPPF